MDSLPISMTDITILAIVLISGLLALIRGFVREIFSLAGWIGAFAIAIFSYPLFRPYVIWFKLSDFFKSTDLADLAIGGTIFVVSKILFTLLSVSISRSMRESELNALDRSLGFVFGLFRGGLVVCVIYIGLVWIWPPPNQPQWIQEARTLIWIKMGAEKLTEFLSESAREKLHHGFQMPNVTSNNVIDRARELEKLVSPPPPAIVPESSPGYKQNDRNNLDRLIESVQ